MIYITFISIGDLPRGPFQEIGQKFKKQLNSYVKFVHKIILDESKIKYSTTNNFVIVLDESGKNMTSNDFAKTISDLENNGEHITIILGGAKGLSNELKNKTNLRLALSKMTTTHDLAHLFFLEQLYRACTINHNKKYHY